MTIALFTLTAAAAYALGVGLGYVLQPLAHALRLI